MRHIIGISIGGTKSAVCYATLEGKEIIHIEKKQIPSSPHDPYKNMEDVCGIIDTYPQDFDFISVICGSPMDAKKGIICKPSNLPGWIDFPILDILKKKYNVPATLLNDADASALAEYHYGAGQGTDNFIYMIVGTGFGSGIIINGKLYTGSSCNAGEIGHVRVSEDGYMPRNKKPGSAEGFVSGGGVGDEGELLSKHHPNSSLKNYYKVSGKAVFDEARKGDELANMIVDQCAKKLGEAIAIYLDLLNPDMIAIGGIYPRCLDLLEEKVHESAKANALDLNYDSAKIVPSMLDERIDDYSSLMGIYL